MSYRSYEWKIIYVLVLVFALIQAGVFVGLSNQNQRIARETLKIELESGAEVLYRWLRLRHRQLEQSARVIAADMELRDAIVRQDYLRAETLLLAHEGRLPAAAVLLSSMKDELLVNISGPAEKMSPANIELRSAEFAAGSHETLVALINRNSDLIYQVITVPVSSNMPVAWLTIAIPLTDSALQTLQDVANTQYSFLSRQTGGLWHEHLSTFRSEDSAVLLPQFEREFVAAQSLTGQSGDFLVMPFALSRYPDIELAAMVGKSLDSAMRPFNQLQRTLLMWVIAGSLITAFAIFAVTRRMVGPLNTLAHVDSLTGLLNRRVFEEAVNKLSADGEALANPKASPFGVMLLDLDGFREINSQMGHEVGDEVLKVIAGRLRDTLRKSDVVARYGGEAFAVLMPNGEQESCERVAEMILESLERKIEIEGVAVEIGVNIGISVSPQDGHNRVILLKKADMAMRSAKSSGRGFAFYNAR